MKTQWNTIRGILEYAKVFEENRDMGTNGKNPGIDKLMKEVDGRYSTRVYPINEEEMEKARNILVDPMFGGHPRFKEGNPDFGVGLYFDLKRDHKDKSGIDDFGGQPEVVHWGEDNKNDPWIMENDGELGNGTEAIVKFTTRGEDTTQSVRLVKIGVINLVEYVREEGERF